MSLKSDAIGPVVWLTGCVHGDEPGGTVIVHEVFRAVRKQGLLCGALQALPLVNSIGFENVSRYINSDREDLNRCFPGDAKGTVGERIAGRIFELIEKTGPDLVIDLHNDWIQSVPYLVIEPRNQFRTRKLYEKTIEAAKSTGLIVVQETEDDDATARSLTGAFVAAGVAAFTIEAGGANGIVEANVAVGRDAVLRALASLGMLSAGPADEPQGQCHGDVLDYTNLPRCRANGIVRFTVSPGDTIEADQEIGHVYSAFGAVEETLRARRGGVVLGVSDHARALPGTEVIAIAEDASRRDDKTETLTRT